MSHRGLTLIEMLLALALLGAVTIAAAAWTALAARASLEHAAPNAWQSAAHATLELIHDDISTGDFTGSEPGRNDSKPPMRVTAMDQTLTIRTREAGIGATIHTYRHDAVAHRLSVSSTSRSGPPQLLLDDVEAFECAADAERAGVLLISIRRTSEPSSRIHIESVSRRIKLP